MACVMKAGVMETGVRGSLVRFPSRRMDHGGECIMYANTINGVLEYHSMYFLYNNKNQ